MKADFKDALFFAEYTSWTIVWILVCYYFATTGYRNWRDLGGRWRDVPSEIWAGLKHMFDLRSKADTFPEGKYPPPHFLLLTITLSGIAYVLSGINYIANVRAGYGISWWQLTIPVFAIVAGIGHLIHPLKRRMRFYRWLVFWNVVWFVGALKVFFLLDSSGALTKLGHHP